MITIRQILISIFAIMAAVVSFFNLQLGLQVWIVTGLFDIADEISKYGKRK